MGSDSLYHFARRPIVEMMSNGNLIKLTAILGLVIGVIMLATTISDVRRIHEKALEISHASHSLHRDMAGSAERLHRTSNTLKETTRHGESPMYRLEPPNVRHGEVENIVTVLRRLGYDAWDGANGTWTLMWSLGYPNKALQGEALAQHQKVNHFRGIKFAMNRKALALEHIKYMPASFLLPDEKENFLTYASSNPSSTWIQKDCTGMQPPQLFSSFFNIDLDKKGAMVQEYVPYPALIDQHKFDIGVFVLVTSIDPLLVYVYDKDWLIRFAKGELGENVSLLDNDRLLVQNDFFTTWDIPSVKDLYEKYKLNHKESLLLCLKNTYLIPDTDSLEQGINKIIADTIRGLKAKMMSSATDRRGNPRNYFELMRFDFMLDIRMTPILLDVDLKPDLSTVEQPQLSCMFEQMIFDALSLVGVGSNLKTSQKQRNEAVGEMLVDKRDVQVLPTQCSTPECQLCLEEICQLCGQCMPNALRQDLEYAYNEHEERRNFRRVYPEPLHNKENARKRDAKREAAMLPKDRLLDLWFRGKCAQDETWCS